MSKRLKIFSTKIYPQRRKLEFLLLFGSIAWFLSCAHQLQSRPTYVSENALLPGNAAGVFNAADESHFSKNHELFNAHLSDAKNVDTLLKQDLLRIIREEHQDWTVDKQDFSFVSNLSGAVSGQNVYAIFKAPRSDGSEALMLSAALKTQKGEWNTYGLAFSLSIMSCIAKSNFYAKDIIVVFHDHQPAGMQAWIQSYLGLKNHTSIKSEKLRYRSGSIQAGLNLEFGSQRGYNRLGIEIEGANGQLPNLDLLNTVQRISQYRYSGIVLHDTATFPAFREDLLAFVAKLVGATSYYHDSIRYFESLWNMLWMAKKQAFALPKYGHAVLLRYRIDSLTLVGLDGNDGQFGSIWAFAELIESTLRSLNSLLEHLHQSFYYYLLPSQDSFVSIGVYFPSLGFLFAILLLRVLSAWYEMSDTFVAEGRKGDPLAIVSATFSIRKSNWTPTIVVLLVAYFFGFGTLVAVHFAPFIREVFGMSLVGLLLGSTLAAVVLLPLVFTALTATPKEARGNVPPCETSSLLESSSLLLTAALVSSLSIINFSLLYFWTLLLCATIVLGGVKRNLFMQIFFSPFLFILAVAFLGRSPALIDECAELFSTFDITADFERYRLPLLEIVASAGIALELSLKDVEAILVSWIDGSDLYSCWVWQFICCVWLPTWVSQYALVFVF